MTTEQLLKKWRLLAPLGLTVIGCGISVIGTAISLKIQSGSFAEWFLWGTAGLILLNAGVAVFGESVKCRVLYELKIEQPKIK